jgi:hypothetical protein
MEKLPLPSTFCTHCRVVGYDVARSNTPCRKRLDRKGTKCKGVHSSAINTTDWEECPGCRATGRSNNEACMQCSGAGWLFARDIP